MKKLLAGASLLALVTAAAVSSLVSEPAFAQQVGQYGIVVSGTPSGAAPSQGDVDISGSFKVNGVAVGASGTSTGLFVTPLAMANMKTAAGLQMTGSASGTNFGLVYTPGTQANLTGTATSSNSTSDVASYDLVLPPNYVAGSNITLKVACSYTDSSGAATVHTMAAAAYLNNTTAGTQGSSLIATSAQVCPITTAAFQTFTITGATLVPGSYLTLTFSAAVTNGSGASTELLTGATIQ